MYTNKTNTNLRPESSHEAQPAVSPCFCSASWGRWSPNGPFHPCIGRESSRSSWARGSWRAGWPDGPLPYPPVKSPRRQSRRQSAPRSRRSVVCAACRTTARCESPRSRRDAMPSRVARPGRRWAPSRRTREQRRWTTTRRLWAPIWWQDNWIE